MSCFGVNINIRITVIVCGTDDRAVDYNARESKFESS